MANEIVSRSEQQRMGLLPQRSVFVPPERMEILPSRHEISDPYANAPALDQAEMISTHTYTPESRAGAMLKKTTAVTVALAIFTGAAMVMLGGWEFFAWLVLASFEWVACFVLLAILDFRETPAAHLRQKTTGYLDLMKREQRARLKKLYGYEED